MFSLSVTFFVIRLMPGNPVTTLAMNIHRSMGVSYEDAEVQARAMLNYDPDKPVLVEYVEYAAKVFRGDLGTSMSRKAPVTRIVGGVLPWTLFISSIALLISFAIGTVMGMYCGWKRRSPFNQVLTVYDSIVGSVPAFVIGYLLILAFAVKLKWLPLRGNYDAALQPGWTASFILSVCKHAVLPVMAWVLATMGSWALGMRAMSVSVLGEDYIVSARARGLPQRRIITSYVGHNAILPQITSLAIQFGTMFSGSVLVENTFIYPGMGYFFSAAIGERDYPLMQGMFLIITIAVVLANQFAEVIYSLIDPRIRKGT